MIRTRTNNPVQSKKRPNLILSADWHLRKDSPVCWMSDFQKEQWDTLDFIADLQKECDCPIIVAGDLFEKWFNSNDFLTIVMQHIPNNLYVIYGQHDLPQHSIDLSYKSSIDTLREAGKLKILKGCHFGQEPKEASLFFPNRNPDINVLVWHHMTYIKPPFPGASGGQADTILRKYPQFDLIVTGDNHQQFSTSVDGRLLVNPGSLTRQTADQIDFQPRVALWYAEDNTIEWVNIPIQQNAITREHLEVKEQRNERIDAFISKLDGDWVAGMSFEENLKAFFEKNNTRDSVKQIIYTSIE